MTAPVDLPQLTALLERATPQLVDGTASVKAIEALLRAAYLGQRPRARNEPRYVEDAELIVALCNSAPALIAELTAARERLAELERMHDECICPKCGVRHGGSKIDGGFCHD